MVTVSGISNIDTTLFESKHGMPLVFKLYVFGVDMYLHLHVYPYYTVTTLCNCFIMWSNITCISITEDNYTSLTLHNFQNRLHVNNWIINKVNDAINITWSKKHDVGTDIPLNDEVNH